MARTPAPKRGGSSPRPTARAGGAAPASGRGRPVASGRPSTGRPVAGGRAAPAGGRGAPAGTGRPSAGGRGAPAGRSSAGGSGAPRGFDRADDRGGRGAPVSRFPSAGRGDRDARPMREGPAPRGQRGGRDADVRRDGDDRGSFDRSSADRGSADRSGFSDASRGRGPAVNRSFPKGLGTPRPRDLGDRPHVVKGPRGLGGDLVEGRQAVRELLLAGKRRVRDVWMVDGTDDAPILEEIEALATEARIVIRKVNRDQLMREARTETPQGVLAHATELEEVDLDGLFQPADGRPPFLLAVDSLTDPQNLGALLRSADGAGVTGVILPRHRNVHITPSVTKAAAGAIERMPIAIVGGLPAAMLQLKKQYSAWFVGLDADGSQTIYDLARLGSEPLVVVVGAEGAGLSRLVRQRCDTIASIPLRGALSSLNASAAGAVALFEFGRHRPMPEVAAAPVTPVVAKAPKVSSDL
jgi:23S rRNA (guanosine2251-2'-O)-methyltransferase